MSEYKVVIKNSAKKDLKKIKQSNLISKYQEIIDTLKQNPYHESQSFEKLYPKHEGRYSRRINVQHRVVYKAIDEIKQVEIYAAWSRYE